MKFQLRRINEAWFSRQCISINALQDSAADFANLESETALVVQIGNAPFFIKTYHIHNLQESIRHGLGFDKARAAYDNALKLQRKYSRHVPVPIALLSSRRPPISLLIAEALQEGGTLAQWMNCEYNSGNLGNQPLTPGINQDLIRQLSRFLADLHKQGIYHSDLHDRNIWVKPMESGLVFFLLDVEAVKFCRRISLRRRLKNLLRLARNIGANAAKMELEGEALALELAESYFQMSGITPSASLLEMVSASARRGKERWTEISQRICG